MEKELKFYTAEKLDRFKGKHIAIIGRKVVAHGRNAIDVFEQAKKKFPTKKPVLAFVPREETLILIY